MIDAGKQNVLGIKIDAVDYEAATEKILDAAQGPNPLAVTALAVHGVMTGVQDRVHASRLNTFDLVVPDGQPVRWALNLMHDAKLPDRCYGPTLMLKVCERAAADGIPVYFYGSELTVIEKLTARLQERFPDLRIAGAQPSLFRRTTEEEKREVTEAIRRSGARICFVGLGCPRQEVWTYEYRNRLSMPIIAVGAAFDFHAGLKAQAPQFLQRSGLEWAFRLSHEPKRLWRRYLILNPLYLSMLAAQATRLRGFEPAELPVHESLEMWG